MIEVKEGLEENWAKLFFEEINQIFAPGKTWADSTGLIYTVETP